MSAVGTYARGDLRAVGRDPLLCAVLVSPLVMLAITRIGVPLLERQLEDRLDFALRAHDATILAFLFTMVVPMLFGMISGLLLAEDRDSGVFRALLVSPVSLSGYLAYRGGTAAAATTVTVLAAVPASGLLERPGWAILPAALLAGVVAATYALAFGAAATDRLEALSVMKATSLLSFAPLAARYTSLDALFGVLPTAWPAYATWAAVDGADLGVTSGVGLGVTAAWLGATWAVMARRVTARGG